MNNHLLKLWRYNLQKYKSHHPNFNIILNNVNHNNQGWSHLNLIGSFREKSTVEVPYKKLTDFSDSTIAQKGKGKIYDKKPFKYTLVKGKKYMWCTCGWSKSQPFCDFTHANPHMRIKLKPVIFIAPESGDYWLCNCKQTDTRPFCSGAHRPEDIQSAIRS